MFEVVAPLLISFIIVLVLGPVAIPMLLRLKIGNTERKELAEHQAKNGTPSMGGIMIIIALVIVSFIYEKSFPHIVPITLLVVSFGVIGFLDDLLKAIKKKSDGLIAWQKMLLQLLVTTVFAFYMANVSDVSMEMRIPFTAAHVDMGIMGIVVLYLCVLGTVNGTNFTDGLDGLATTVTIVVAAFFGLCSIKLDGGITPICAAMVGALMGFLCFNVHPAKVFMGDTGSLALGGFVVGCAYMLQMPLFILIVGLIYLIEVLSVIIQVSYFKFTKKTQGKGKRIFRMAPIHHHFEKGGWSEVKVVAVFSIVTGILCTFAYYLL